MRNLGHFGAIVILAVTCSTACKQQQVQSKSGPAAVPVAVAKVSQESVPLNLKAVGTVEPSSVVQIKSQVAGQIKSTHFTEGQNVAAGALLFEIDSRPFQEALRQAEAALSRDRAQLKQAEATLARDQAQLKNAEAESGRFGELAKAGIISKSQHDQVRTSADVTRESVHAAQAAIESARAALESDMAAIEKAKLDIGYCRIVAPISGRTGNILVHPGNLVRVNDVALVVIHQISPVFVTFAVPEQHLASVRRLNASNGLKVRVSPQDDPSRFVEGRLSLVDNTVDTMTGTIRLKASMQNSDGLLWPGQFVNVVLTLDTTRDALVVPLEAVQSGQKGHYVYVVRNDNTVEARVVEPGRSFERSIIVAKGVNAGETVVVDGHLRVAPGSRVRIVPASIVEGGKS